MSDKRKHIRFNCKIKTKFQFNSGNPENREMENEFSEKGSGFIMDISKGGLYIFTESRVNISQPILIEFKVKPKSYSIKGKIIRTGIIKNNPISIARDLDNDNKDGEYYIAVQFDESLESLDTDKLKK